MDSVDALTSAPVVESPDGLSESPLFRREFSSIYDFLKSGQMPYHILRKVLFRNQPEEAETIGGYEVYAVDYTADTAPEAETLREYGQSKKGRYAPI